jgi:hypothetical protein
LSRFFGGAQVDFSFRPTAEKAITYHQPATAARKGQKKLVMTIRTANPGEAFLQSPAFEEVFDDF